MVGRTTRLVCILLTGAGFGSPAFAEHSWGEYHWARTSTSFDLTIVNSTTSDWGIYVTEATADWSQSSALNMVEDPDGATSKKVRRRCKAPNGQVRICNLAYGQNGWVGLAGISVDTDGHIVRGYTKLNDSYFKWDFYNTPDWKQSVTCQELGHDVGLNHQDQDFNNTSLLTCMDYQNPPWPDPNGHDFEQLDSIYAHIDTDDTYSGGGSSGGDSGDTCNAPPGKGCNKSGVGNNGDIGWGISIGRRGQEETFIRVDPDGTRHITHVIWAIGH
ncbi:MAG: hypothetical protein O7F71_02955 [Gammaproteobacteria bacterium]|nr:hypothetical protein [Gammaproteobacteria bacterium]